MMKKATEVFCKLWRILTRGQKILGVGVLLCSALAAALEMLGVSVVVPLVNALLQPEQLFAVPYIRRATDALGIHTNESLVIFVVAAVVGVYLFKNLYFIFLSWVKNKYSCKVRRECSVYMMQSYMNRGYDFFLRQNVNELIQGVSGDVSYLYNIINALLQVIVQMFTVLFIGIYMCCKDWQIAVGVLLSAILCLLLIVVFFRRQMERAGVRIRTYNIRASKALLQAFQGIKEVLVMRKQKYFIREYEDNVSRQQDALVVQGIGSEIPAYIIEAVCVTGIMAILGVRIVNLTDPQNFVAVLAAFAIGAFRILPALGKVSMSVNTITSSLSSLDAVYENLIEARRFHDKFFSVEAEDETKYQGRSFRDAIRIQRLTFAYNADQKNVLDDLSLEIPKGKSVAFVGESGAGKSTLADLILGVLTPGQGEILMDDINIRRIPGIWSRSIGYVPQSIYLSDASVCENVAFGIEEKEIDEALVWEALKKAELADFVSTLPEGIYTEVGDRGVRLSGGQRQRIGIARALYHDPDILILDEATSALDNETERAVMEAIDALHGRMTMIIIAHRLTTIKNCDDIYEIVNGKAVRRRYEELI